MKNTLPRGYRYPECDPNLVRDASDIGQVANLATDVDRDIQTIADDVTADLLRPDAASLGTATSQTLEIGGVVTFDTVLFDNTVGQVMAQPNGIRTRIEGTYLVTYWVNITSNTGNLRGAINLAGIGLRSYEGLGAYTTMSARPGAHVTGSVVFRSPPGRLFQLTALVGEITAGIVVATAGLSVIRLGDL